MPILPTRYQSGGPSVAPVHPPSAWWGLAGHTAPAASIRASSKIGTSVGQARFTVTKPSEVEAVRLPLEHPPANNTRRIPPHKFQLIASKETTWEKGVIV